MNGVEPDSADAPIGGVTATEGKSGKTAAGRDGRGPRRRKNAA